MAYIICYDAGFVNLGYMVAKLPRTPDEKPKPIDFGVSEAALPKKAERALRTKSVTYKNLHRILRQVDTVQGLHEKYNPVAYFVEMPHGGARGALAIRGMSFATAYLATSIHLLAPDACFKIFLPNQVKKAVTGNRNASKLDIARAVLAYWPEIDHWPGFKVIAKKKTKKGKKIVEEDKAASHDATDAGAVCITATTDESYMSLFYGEGNTCRSELDL
jgi:Holliday junction resolvasome RuvABC endonuclease subunit